MINLEMVLVSFSNTRIPGLLWLMHLSVCPGKFHRILAELFSRRGWGLWLCNFGTFSRYLCFFARQLWSYLHTLSCLSMYFVRTRTGQRDIKCWIVTLFWLYVGIVFYRFVDLLFYILCRNGFLLYCTYVTLSWSFECRKLHPFEVWFFVGLWLVYGCEILTLHFLFFDGADFLFRVFCFDGGL